MVALIQLFERHGDGVHERLCSQRAARHHVQAGVVNEDAQQASGCSAGATLGGTEDCT